MMFVCKKGAGFFLATTEIQSFLCLIFVGIPPKQRKSSLAQTLVHRALKDLTKVGYKLDKI